MNRTAFYSTIKDSGFTVIAYVDRPQFFGNWRAHFKRGNNRYELVSDSREGWLTLWRQRDNKGERLFEVDSNMLNQEQETALIKQWLEAVKNLEFNSVPPPG